MVFMPHWPKQLGYRPIQFGLSRVLALLEELGNPHQHLPPVVHVAGTNGKGSTIAFLRAFLEAAGYRVHVYSSPHLLDFNERIVLAGRQIEDGYLRQVMEECRLAVEKNGTQVTFFEGTTAGAFLAFSRCEADIVLLETGMGGRLDATNVIDVPLLTVITPIALDHTEFLGDHILQIADEKAGILKSKVPSVIGMQYEAVRKRLEDRAALLESTISVFDVDYKVDAHESGMCYTDLHRSQTRVFPKPALVGDHQLTNAATAIAAMGQLTDFRVEDAHIAKGLTHVNWPGRMQQIKQGALESMLADGWELWVDGAHNSAGAHVLSCILEDWQDRPCYLVVGFTKGRDPLEILTPFKGKVAAICSVLVETEPSAESAASIAEKASPLGIPIHPVGSIVEALEYLQSQSTVPARVICCGSLYLVSDVLRGS